MERFEATLESLDNADGTLAYCGVAWTERREWLSDMLDKLIAIAIGGIALGWFLASNMEPGQTGGAILPVGFAVILAALAAFKWYFGTRSRSFYFLADGQVHFPEGLPYAWRKTRLLTDITNVQGFEVREVRDPQKPNQEPTYNEWLYLRDGDILCLSVGHWDWQAHKIVTLLTAAYRQMSDARASIHQFKFSPQSQARRKELVIE